MTNYEVQQIAKNAMEYTKNHIYVGQSLIDLRRMCENKMLELGADSFWYYDIGAFVFSDDDTAMSLSGRKYETSDRIIKENDIITIDLSPSHQKIWGDYARTVIVENGKVTENFNEIQNPQWRNALKFEEYLHYEFCKYVNENTTFEDAYYFMNNMIEKEGYINLDFNGNLGHTIRKHKFQRVYIEKGNYKKISSAKYVTFEPHIGIKNTNFGFKREDIYYFNGNRLTML